MLKQLYVLALCLCCRCFFSFADGNSFFIKFTENKGQWDANVLFRAQLDGGVLFLEKNCFTYNFYEKEKVRRNHIHSSDWNPAKEELEIKSHAFRMTLKNAVTPKSVLPQKKSINYSNFFIGKDSKKWASHAYDYEMVYYKEIYSGIDLEVNGKPNSLKYNFIVNPGADVSKICMSYYGVKKIIDENGSLRIETPLTSIVELKPYAYQEINGARVPVPCYFVVKNNEVTFSLPENYRSDIPLIIDPTLIFSSYSGSFADNFGMTATYDNFGNFYAGGTAWGPGYPYTSGAFDTTYNGVTDTNGLVDVVISKYDSSGRALIYSTYFGGSVSTEIVTSLIVNSNNELMLLGTTGSSDFPTSPGAYDSSFNGGDSIYYQENGAKFSYGSDIYVAKFSADGSQLLASTFVGGSANDGINSKKPPHLSNNLAFNYGDYFRGEIQTDAAGNFYVASCTYSANFPVTAGSVQQVQGGLLDACVFKMTSNLDTMLWSTYLGGNSYDCGNSLIIDKTHNVYVTGGTKSPDFPTTSSTMGPVFKGGSADGYISKISADGTTLLRSTFIGTADYDQSYFVQSDTLEHIYVFGQSLGNFPITGNVYSNPGSKQFIAILSSGLDTLLYSTVVGNTTPLIKLSPAAFLVDRCGNIYISGWGGPLSNNNFDKLFNMPVTTDAFQADSLTSDGRNFYFAVYGPYLQIFQYGTYFGGNQSPEHVDGGTSRFDPQGILYQSVCAGCWGNSDFPTTDSAWSNVNHGQNFSVIPGDTFPGCNNAVIKMNMNVQNTKAEFLAAPKWACPYVDVTFTNQSVAGFNFYWDFGDGSPISNSVHATHAYNTGGTYIVSLIASSPFCGIDTAWDTINVYIPPSAAFTHSGIYCINDTIQFTNGSSGTSPPLTYQWTFGDSDSTTVTHPSHAYNSSGNYIVTLIAVDSLGCIDTTTQNVNIHPPPAASINYSIDTCALTASLFGNPSSASAYFWDFGDSDSDNIQNPSHTYDSSGTYLVTLVVTDTIGCIDTVTQSISPYSFSKADFIFDVDTCSFVVQFKDQSLNAYINDWNFGDASANSSSKNPVHSYPAAGNYRVTLIVNPGMTCVDTVYQNIYLDEQIFANYFIPNIFTPNSDSYNPRFTIKGLDFCDDFLLKVYNRWGELMFESTNILDSWDGTHKGKDVPDGVYFYIIKGKRINRAGTVTVKRK